MQETELAVPVINFLSDAGHEIYQEVKTPWGVVDIVAKCGQILWSVEVKTTCNLAVLGQALQNKFCFHYSSIAVPQKRRGGKSRIAVNQFCRQNGLGIISISTGYQGLSVTETQGARFQRRVLSKYVHLFEEQKHWAAAGTNTGKAYSPFQHTKQKLIQFVEKNPGCSMREVMESIEHHYNKISTAMSCTRQWIYAGVISEIRIKDGKLFLSEEVA